MSGCKKCEMWAQYQGEIDYKCDCNPEVAVGNKADCSELMKEIDQLKAQVERLKEELESAAAQYVACDCDHPSCTICRDRKGIEDLLKETQPPSAANPWIDWHGGGSPVEPGALVDVEFRDDSPSNGERAGGWNWMHETGAGDIVKYRLHKDEEK